VKTFNAEGKQSRLGPRDDAVRKRAAVEIYARNEKTLRRTARRYSLCADDAEDALQRGLEILLRKAPTDNPRELIKWMQTVVKHEALAVRRDRERILAGPAAITPEPDADDWVALLPATSDGPAERAERQEAVARSREALQTLKPQELRALTLLAEGYSYAEIGEITGYSRTKINRCLAEGRERFRKLLSRSEDGSRCTEMKPLISVFCDGEAKPEEVKTLREHLRACAHCRATLRTYRAAPAAAAALAPPLPLERSLFERAHDAVADLAARFTGARGGDALSQAAAGGTASGVGAAAIAKVAAVCIGTAGGAAACVATGLLPAPPKLAPERDPAPRLERRLIEIPVPEVPTPKVESPLPPAPEAASPKARPRPQPAPTQDAAPESAEPVSEPAPVITSSPVESAPPPAPEPVAEPAPEPAPVESAGGTPAGEFGP
jgi:RNA polymerase sigma factor (sigma-70 family)